MAKLLLGKEVNASINEEIKAKVEKLKALRLFCLILTKRLKL